MPATDQAVRSRPWIALTLFLPNMSRRYAGIVANPPPYMLMMIAAVATKNVRLFSPYEPVSGRQT